MKTLNFLNLVILLLGPIVVHAQTFELAVRGVSLNATDCLSPLPAPVVPDPNMIDANYPGVVYDPRASRDCRLPILITRGCHNSQRISSNTVQSIYRLRFETAPSKYVFYDAKLYCGIQTTDLASRLAVNLAKPPIVSSPVPTYQVPIYQDTTRSCLNSGNDKMVTTVMICGGTAFQALLDQHRNQPLTVNVIHYLTQPFLPAPVQLMGGG